jgi:hypothetical protein
MTGGSDSVKEASFLFACFFSCMLSSGGLAGAQGSNQILIVASEKRPEIQAEYLRQVFPEVRANIENALGWKLLSTPRVLLVGDKDIFEKMSGNPMISAFALPGRHSIVIYLPSAASEPYMLRETFEHELCHLLLHEHIRETFLPKWLDEGICQWISGSFGEILVGRGFTPGDMNLSRHPIALQQLTMSFPKDKESLIQAYVGSRLFVDFLVARHGKEALLSILQHMKEGEPIEQAVHAVLSKSLESLQGEWLEKLQGRSEWLLWVSQYLYEILFFLGALLTVLAYIRVMFRKRGYDPDEEDEE